MKCKRNDTVNRSFGRTKRRAAEKEKEAMPGDLTTTIATLSCFLSHSLFDLLIYSVHAPPHQSPRLLSLSHTPLRRRRRRLHPLRTRTRGGRRRRPIRQRRLLLLLCRVRGATAVVAVVGARGQEVGRGGRAVGGGGGGQRHEFGPPPAAGGGGALGRCGGGVGVWGEGDGECGWSYTGRGPPNL